MSNFNARQMARSPIVNVMAVAAEKAGRILIRDFGELENLQVTQKSLGNFVSTADKAAERVLIQELSKSRPEYSFLAEESGVILGKNKDVRWVIDPLDGTTNFLHGIPHFCISIALQKKNEILAGVIFDPIKDELFWAEKGGGAYLNQRRLRTSGRRDLSEALIGAESPFGDWGDKDKYLERVGKAIPATAGIRGMGSAALGLAYVAAGRHDLFFGSSLSPWDIAAGILLVREAGGNVSEIEGGLQMLDSGSILASNSYLHENFKNLLMK